MIQVRFSRNYFFKVICMSTRKNVFIDKIRRQFWTTISSSKRTRGEEERIECEVVVDVKCKLGCKLAYILDSKTGMWIRRRKEDAQKRNVHLTEEKEEETERPWEIKHFIAISLSSELWETVSTKWWPKKTFSLSNYEWQ